MKMQSKFITLCSIVESQNEITLEDKPHLRNHVNTLHAGVLFTLAEQSLRAHLEAEEGIQADPKAFSFSILYKKPAKGILTASTECSIKSEEYRTKIVGEDDVTLVEIIASKSTEENHHV